MGNILQASSAGDGTPCHYERQSAPRGDQLASSNKETKYHCGGLFTSCRRNSIRLMWNEQWSNALEKTKTKLLWEYNTQVVVHKLFVYNRINENRHNCGKSIWKLKNVMMAIFYCDVSAHLWLFVQSVKAFSEQMCLPDQQNISIFTFNYVIC